MPAATRANTRYELVSCDQDHVGRVFRITRLTTLTPGRRPNAEADARCAADAPQQRDYPADTYVSHGLRGAGLWRKGYYLIICGIERLDKSLMAERVAPPGLANYRTWVKMGAGHGPRRGPRGRRVYCDAQFDEGDGGAHRRSAATRHRNITVALGSNGWLWFGSGGARSHHRHGCLAQRLTARTGHCHSLGQRSRRMHPAGASAAGR